MSSNTEILQLKSFERWQLAAHCFLGIGTLCFTIAAIVQAATEGKLSDMRQQNTTPVRDREVQSSTSASDYFRGRL